MVGKIGRSRERQSRAAGRVNASSSSLSSHTRYSVNATVTTGRYGVHEVVGVRMGLRTLENKKKRLKWRRGGEELWRAIR